MSPKSHPQLSKLNRRKLQKPNSRPYHRPNSKQSLRKQPINQLNKLLNKINPKLKNYRLTKKTTLSQPKSRK